jgi:Transposase DDE domain
MRRHRDQKLLDRARRQANTKQAKLDRKRRQHLIERSFADASNLHGFKRARWRGLIKQSIQDLLIAAVQNLRKLIAAMHYASENSYLALIDTLSSFLQAFTTLLTTDLPFLILDLPPVLLPSIPASTPISPVVRATDRRERTPRSTRSSRREARSPETVIGGNPAANSRNHRVRGKAAPLPSRAFTQRLLALSLNSSYSLDSFFALNQRLINQIGKTLEEAVFVVWEVLGKDEHDEFLCRINQT